MARMWKRKKSRVRNRASKVRVIIWLLLILFAWISIQIIIPNMTGVTLYESMPSMKTGKCSTIIDGNLIDDEYYPIVYENGEVLIASEVVRKYFDDSILRNDNFIITIKDGNYVRFEAGSKKIVVNDRIKKSKVAAQLEGDEIYLPCDVLAKLYTLEYRFIDETNVLIIDTDKSERFSCMTLASENLKIDGKVSGTVQEGESVTSYKTIGDETLIVTSLGACGFIKSSNLEKVSELKLESKLEELTSGMTLGILSVNLNGDDDKVVLKKNKKNILWYQVTSKKANPKGDEIIFPESVNTICFTWFDISDSEGNIYDKVSTDVIKKAHEEGLEVWALVANDFDNSSVTHDFLSSPVSREKAISKLMSLCKKYDIDGINVDIESIKKDSGEYYVQFIKEISTFSHLNNLVLSVDMYMPTQSNEYYGRSEFTPYVDYYCLMAYDEHWRTCGVAGSVGSLPWVEKGLKGTLEIVPKDKLILGIPFYTRLWGVDKKGEVVSSKALGMENAAENLEENKAKAKFDKTTGQNYSEYKKDNITYKVWLEDETSISSRLALASRYGLGGVASWKHGFEKDSIWLLYENYLK